MLYNVSAVRRRRREEEKKEREEEDDEEKEEEAGRARTCETTKTCFSVGESDVLDSTYYFKQRETRRRRRRRRSRGTSWPRTCYCIWRRLQKR